MLFKIYRYWYTDLLLEVKFYFVSKHLRDDSDKLAGTMPKGIIVGPAFRHLGIVVSLESGVVFYNIVSCVNKCISEYFGTTLRHSGFLSLEVSGLVNRRIQDLSVESRKNLSKVNWTSILKA